MADDSLRGTTRVTEITLTLVVKADLISLSEDSSSSRLAGSKGRRSERSMAEYIPATALAFESLTARLFGDADRGRRALRRRIEDLERTPVEAEEVGHAGDGERPLADPVDPREALWELFDRFGYHDAYVVHSVAPPLAEALAGRFHPFPLGNWYSSRGGLPDVQIRCVKIEFETGSLWTTTKLILQGTSAILTLMFAAAGTPIVKEGVVRWQVTQEMHTTYGEERCVTSAVLDIDGSALLDATAEELNFHANGLSTAERTRSVCLIQFALHGANLYSGAIDGIPRANLGVALEKFAAIHHTSHHIADPALRRELAAALHAGARKLVQ